MPPDIDSLPAHPLPDDGSQRPRASASLTATSERPSIASDRSTSLGQLHQELENEQEAQVVRTILARLERC